MAALWEEFCCCIIPPRPLGPGVLPCHFSLKHQTDVASIRTTCHQICVYNPTPLTLLPQQVGDDADEVGWGET